MTTLKRLQQSFYTNLEQIIDAYVYVKFGGYNNLDDTNFVYAGNTLTITVKQRNSKLLKAKISFREERGLLFIVGLTEV